MADYVEGKVLKASKKPTNSGGTVYNLQVETDQGDEWFGCGFDDPKVNQGDVISFDIAYNGEYMNVDMDTLEILEKAPQRQSSNRGSNRGSSRGNGRSASRGKSDSSRGSRSGGSGRSGSGDNKRGNQSGSRSQGGEKKPAVDWDRKDLIISQMSCQNTAVATIGMLIANNLVAIPKKKADSYDAVMALVEAEAARLRSKYNAVADGNYDDGLNDPDDRDGGRYDDEDGAPE